MWNQLVLKECIGQKHTWHILKQLIQLYKFNKQICKQMGSEIISTYTIAYQRQIQGKMESSVLSIWNIISP